MSIVTIQSEELIALQRHLISGNMSDTDLSNWFFEFCRKNDCEVNETMEEARTQLRQQGAVR